MAGYPKALPDTVGPAGRERNVHWGDIHCHCSVGVAYSKGSLDRLYDVARSHLDVLAFTPHGWWHDMDASDVPERMYLAHADGFETSRRCWDDVRAMCRSRDRPGEFVSLLAYEWHSSRYGDHCVIFPGDEGEIFRASTLDEFKDFARRHGALLIPHHVAYRSEHRGFDWSTLDPDLTPVVEIYSEHGLSEDDTSIWPYVAHSPGPADTSQTIQRALASGKRFGFTASSDGHFGYPGSWGEGLTGFVAEDLTRESILQAIRSRHTVAITGDRITPWLSVEGDGPRRIEYHATLCGPLMALEVVRNTEVIHVRPQPPVTSQAPEGKFVARLRVEWGWGGLGSGGFFDWAGAMRVRGGDIRRAIPLFQCADHDEERRNLITDLSDRECAWRSYTTRTNAWKGIATNSIVFEVEGDADTALAFEFECDGSAAFEVKLGELLRGNVVRKTSSVFTAPSILISRALTPAEYVVSGSFEDDRPGREADAYYLRVTQRNGQMAWTSPVFVG